MRKARELTGLDQSAFAAAIGISRQSVSNYELGKTRVRRIVLNAWAAHTKVPYEWLSEDGANPPRSLTQPMGSSKDHQTPRVLAQGALEANLLVEGSLTQPPSRDEILAFRRRLPAAPSRQVSAR